MEGAVVKVGVKPPKPPKKEGEKEITLFGTGEPLRQFMYTGDFAQVIKTMVERKISSVW